MDETVGNDYRFRLNKDANNYQEILSDIKNQLKQNQELHSSKNLGNWQSYFNVDNSENNVIQVIMVADYSPAPVDLSLELLNKIKQNIKTNPNQYYAYSMDRGLNEGIIKNCAGIAKVLADKIS